MHSDHARELPPSMTVIPFPDPLVERHGFGPMHPYIESCYLPVLGPTATFLYRRLGTWVSQEDNGLRVDTIDLAASMGLGEGLAKSSLVARATGRLVLFDAARWWGDALAVRRALPPLTTQVAGHLAYSAYQAHKQFIGSRAS